MSKKDDDSDPTTFAPKWAKVLKEIPEFKDTADAASTEELKQIIVRCEGNISDIEKEKDKDEKLNGARDCVKEFSAPYREAEKIQMAKIKYAVFCLEGKGINVGDDKDE